MQRTGYSNLHRSLFNKKIYGMRIDPCEDSLPPNPSELPSYRPPPYESSGNIPPPIIENNEMDDFDDSIDNLSPPNPMPIMNNTMPPMMGGENDHHQFMNGPFPPMNVHGPLGSPPKYQQRVPPCPPRMNQSENPDRMIDEDQSPQPQPRFFNDLFNQPEPNPKNNQNQFSPIRQQMGGEMSFMRVNSFVTTKNEKGDLEFDKSVQNQFSMYRRQSSSSLLLPTIRPGKSKHPQCNTIHGKTLARFFQKKRKQDIIMVDCRFPYEYQNGTIRGSVNIYQEHVLKAYFFTKKRTNSIVIFYCEYSSKRGPRMYESMRKFDREENLEKYPCLDYPQIYLLEGGYRKFYKRNKKRGYGLCEPDTYCRMDHPKFHCEFQRSWKEMKDSFKSKMCRGFGGGGGGVGGGGVSGKRKRRARSIQEGYQRHNSFNLRYLNRQ